MISLKSLKVESFDYNSNTLVWEFEPTSETLSGYNFEIWKCESPGPLVSGLTPEYTIVASGINSNSYFYTDITVSGLHNHNRTWFYKMKIIDTVNSEVSVQPLQPAWINSQVLDNYSRAIIRKKELHLNKLVGRNFYLFKRRTWGTKCTTEWDAIRQAPTGYRCDTCNCFGTGWIGAYFDPIPFKGMLNPNPKITQILLFGEFMPSDSLLSTLRYPPITPGDVIVDNLNKRWLVQQSRPIEKLGVILEQIVQVALIHPSDELYTLEVPNV